MVHIIGRMISIAVLGVSLIASAAEIRFVNNQGLAVQSVHVQERYRLEIVMTSSARITQNPTIKHDATIIVGTPQYHTQQSIINGVQRSEQKIIYPCQFTVEGTHTLGPLRIITNQEELTSDGFTFQVQPARPAQKSKDAFSVNAEWRIEPRAYYQGEVIPYALRFISSDHAVSVVNMSPISITHGAVMQTGEPVVTTETHNGEHVYVLTWNGYLIVQEPGDCIVPSVAFEYTHPGLQKRSQGFFALFGLTKTIEQCHAAGKKLNIQVLPPTREQYCGVGSNVRAVLQSDATQIQQYDAISIVLSVQAKAALESFDTPEFEVPGSYVYPSASQITGVYPSQTKTYEYIVQCNEPGIVTIPAQKIRYFNPRIKEYETCSTAPLTLHVKAAPVAKNSPQAPEEIKTGVIDNKLFIFVEKLAVLPLWLFMVLLLVPVVIFYTRHVWCRCVTTLRQRRNINRLLAQLQDAADKRDTHRFVQLFENIMHTLEQAYGPLEDTQLLWHAVHTMHYSSEKQQDFEKIFERITVVVQQLKKNKK